MASLYQLPASGPHGLSAKPSQVTGDPAYQLGNVPTSLMHQAVAAHGQLPKEWIQTLISQTDRTGNLYGHAHMASCKHDPSQTGSSDSDSDDISRSLSILLSQQQQQQQLQVNAKRFHTIGLPPHSGDYNATLMDILGFGFDSSRRVMSLPNSIGNMAMDIPTDAHAPGVMDIPAVAGLGIGKTEDAQQMDSMAAAAAAVGLPSQHFMHAQLAPTMLTQSMQPPLMANSAPMSHQHHHLGIVGLTVSETQRPADILSFHTQTYPPLTSAAIPGSSIAMCGSSRSSVGTEMNSIMPSLAGLKRGFHTTVPSPEKTGASLDDSKPEMHSSTVPSTPRAKRGRPRSSKRQTQRGSTAKPAIEADSAESKSLSSIVTEAVGPPPLHPSSFTSNQGDLLPSTPLTGDPPGHVMSEISASHSSGTPSLSSSTSTPAMPGLIPHRVDRQLAAAARPLLFVRPRIKDDQPRRRKRRCLSSNPGSAAGTPVDTPPDIVSAVPMPGPPLGEDGQTNLQWQRISEQRRRDAMRENFDLLKRMLPQEYMTSDDGRELARPVLLARFLRWVDDTLIEMENLKSEVARLKMQLQPGAMPIGGQQGTCGWEGQAREGAPQQLSDSSPMWEVAEAVAVAAAAAAAAAAASNPSPGETAESSNLSVQPSTQNLTPSSDASSQLLSDL
ncbi:hypothetical protein EC988_001359 [Linderina pennispora]|nr:hypothetical protein EC988_001359 [Linderina pennispora]